MELPALEAGVMAQIGQVVTKPLGPLLGKATARWAARYWSARITIQRSKGGLTTDS